jgi:hypothetical protein
LKELPVNEDVKEQQEASRHARIFGMLATRLATNNKRSCESCHDSRATMAVLWHPWVRTFGSRIGVEVQNSNGSILLAEAKLENQNHKNQQK